MKKSLIKLDIIEKIQEKLGLSRLSSVCFFEALFQEIQEALVLEERLKISSFASFIVIQKKERPGRNPKSKKPFVITPRKVVVFHPSRYLRDIVSKGIKKPN